MACLQVDAESAVSRLDPGTSELHSQMLMSWELEAQGLALLPENGRTEAAQATGMGKESSGVILA